MHRNSSRLTLRATLGLAALLTPSCSWPEYTYL